MKKLLRNALLWLSPVARVWLVKNKPELGKMQSPNAAPKFWVFPVFVDGRVKVLMATENDLDDMIERTELNDGDVPKALRKYL